MKIIINCLLYILRTINLVYKDYHFAVEKVKD